MPKFLEVSDRVAARDYLGISSTFNVKFYGATGDGTTDDTAAISAAITAATSGAYRGIVEFPPGRYKFGGITNGTATSDGGRGFTLRGAGPQRTVLVPRSATETMLTTRGGSDISAMIFEDATVEITENRPYNVPVILVEGHRNWRFNRFDLNAGFSGGYTGTFILLDGSYEGSYRDSNWNRGHYCIPIETRNDFLNPNSGTPDQADTFTFSHIVNNMTFGPIHRGPTISGGEIHGIKYDHYKAVDHWSSNDINSLTTVSTNAAADATTITVASASGFSAGDPIQIGANNTIEVNKISSISGNVITLAQPLSFAHVAATNGDNRVIRGSFAMSLGHNVNMLTVDQAHFERHYYAIRLGNVNVVSIDRIYSFATNVLLMVGGVKSTHVGATAMGGTNIGNNLISVPSWRTDSNIGMTDIQGPFWDVRVSVAPSISPGGSSLFHGANYRAKADKSATILQDRWHSNGFTDKLRSVTSGLSLTEVMYDTYAGQGFYADGVATKDLGAIDGKTSAQIDALFASAPPNGHTATGTLGGSPVFLMRRDGSWNVSCDYSAMSSALAAATPKIASVLDSNGATSLSIYPTASAVNYFQVLNAAAGGSPTLTLLGSDTTQSMNIQSRGASSVYLKTGNGTSLRAYAGSNAANYITVTGIAAGSAPVISAGGSDTHISLDLQPKGSGTVTVNANPVGVKVSAPASATATGVVGQWAADSSYVYVCTAANTWKRAAIAAW